MAKVTSSAVEDISYDHATQKMTVKFKGGRTYTYHDVPAAKHTEVITAKSIGKAMATLIIGKHRHS